jgi:hypothetical protein
MYRSLRRQFDLMAWYKCVGSHPRTLNSVDPETAMSVLIDIVAVQQDVAGGCSAQ